MYYLPSEFINSNYNYTINNDYITIHTNNNCYQQYNTTYCDCYNVYPRHNYLTTDTYSCNYHGTYTISSDNFTSDNMYRIDLPSILFIFLIFAIFIIYIPYKIISRSMGRWLKV